MFTTKIPWVVLLLLWLGVSTYWHLCRIKLLCPDETALVTAPSASSMVPGLRFNDGSSTEFNSPGHLAFAKSGAKATINGVQPLLDSLALYLKSHPEKQLQLTGFFGSNEQNSSPEANLGVARAASVRAYLVNLGAHEGQLPLAGEEKSDLSFTPAGDSLYGGVRFAFLDEILIKSQKPTGEEELAKSEKFESIFEPLDLYFNTGKIDYIKTGETNAFLEKTKEYLESHPEQKLVITGHTDNVGPDELNLALSRKRATAVKMHFVRAGITTSQIEVQAKGEAQPIASNDSEEGRRANRRTAVVVKK